MKHGSLFSGIGGFDLAAQWMGWENVFHCEWNPFGQTVLKYYWPNAISYHDITQTDFNIHRGSIDIITGGFPCQPYSSSGKRLGKEDDRHLWPEMLRAIREIQPSWVVGENVRGLTNWNGGMVFDEVQSDLENEGYEVTPYLLPAVAVNAPHRRDRIWFISRLTTHASGNGFGRNKESPKIFKAYRKRFSCDEFESFSGIGIVANTNCERYEGRSESKKSETATFQPSSLFTSGVGRAWKDFPTQPPICNGNDGLSSKLDRAAILTATKSKSNAGSHYNRWRSESVKAAGNAIVPQLAYQIFKAIEKTL